MLGNTRVIVNKGIKALIFDLSIKPRINYRHY